MDQFQIRTDLALEERERFAGTNTEVEGVVLEKDFDDENNLEITTVIIKNEQGAEAMRKPIGTYVTLESQEMLYPDEAYHEMIAEKMAKVIQDMISEMSLKNTDKPLQVMVVGLGNIQITPDALGPLCAGKVQASRHMYQEYGKEGLEDCQTLASISTFAPGVMAETGMESAEMIAAVVNSTQPDLLIVIDALAARSIKRLNTTIQITDTGISPGYGVGNFRGKINQESIGVPVIAIGVPTVIDAATIVYDTLREFSDEEEGIKNLIDPHLGTMYMTPNDVDEVVRRFSDTISSGIQVLFGIKQEDGNIV